MILFGDCKLSVKCYLLGVTDSILRLDSFLPYRLSFTSNLVSDSIADQYRALFNISIPEWRVLAWVAEKDGITQREICQATRMDKVTVSRATIALTDRGILAQIANDNDGRSRRIRLSEEGRRMYAAIAPKALELERRIFGHFTADEREGLMAMLRRIDEIVTTRGE